MKILGLASAAVLGAATLPGAAAFSKVLSESDESRNLMHYTVVFEECLHKHVDVCKDLIQQKVTEFPSLFDNRDHLDYYVQEVRTAEQEEYYLVGLRTDVTETHVTGITGDGMVWYPFVWNDSVHGPMEIGPWDCDVGTPLTVEACCNMIKTTVPNADVNGNHLDCYADHPVGSTSNPVNYGRVSIHVNSNNIVVREPKNE